jgi:hypothetical protein
LRRNPGPADLIPRLVDQFAPAADFLRPRLIIKKHLAQIDLLPKYGHGIALHGWLHKRSTRSIR